MYKMTCFAVAVVLSGCATGASGTKSELPTVSAPGSTKEPEPRQQRQFAYGIRVPGEGWTMQQNVQIQAGVPPAKVVLTHLTKKKQDGQIIIFTGPAAARTTEQMAAGSKIADEKGGAVVTAFSCSKEKPPLQCEYRAVVKTPNGNFHGKIAFRALPEVEELAAFTGTWAPEAEAVLLPQFDAIVQSLTIKIAK